MRVSPTIQSKNKIIAIITTIKMEPYAMAIPYSPSSTRFRMYAVATRVSAVTKKIIALTVVMARTKLVTKADNNAGFNSGNTIYHNVFQELPFKESEASSRDLSSCPKPAIAARIPIGKSRMTMEITTMMLVPVMYIGALLKARM